MKFKAIFSVVIAIASTLAFAHSGGTDSNGCHTESRTGRYHCH